MVLVWLGGSSHALRSLRFGSSSHLLRSLPVVVGQRYEYAEQNNTQTQKQRHVFIGRSCWWIDVFCSRIHQILWIIAWSRTDILMDWCLLRRIVSHKSINMSETFYIRGRFFDEFRELHHNKSSIFPKYFMQVCEIIASFMSGAACFESFFLHFLTKSSAVNRPKLGLSPN